MIGAPLLLAEALSAAAPRGAQAGQVLEGFDSPDGQDYTAFFRDERAVWGRGSALSATSHFPGDGGPGGDFDLRVRAPQGLILDTGFSVIVNEQQTQTQTVIGGVVNLRHLTVDAGATLQIRGPNPARILASGNVRIDGSVIARGTSNLGVTTFNTGLPQPGSAGTAGGGRGGTASYLQGQSTPIGEPGYGAFNSLGGGGGGGETGYNSSSNVNFRRGAGGGGGRFAADQRIAVTGCADQARIGLDAEQGGPGALQANGAIGGPGVRPQPGLPGAGPFVDGDPTNDFWGRMVTASSASIVGELPRPWAGAGGGGGGNAVQSSVFPNPFWCPSCDEVGAGGGGGGGSILIQALGDVVLGANAKLDVSGGTGGGGENTSGINRVGAGSGGGSGGHLVLQSARTIDLRACANPGTGTGALVALGGQGGEGMDGVGGAGPGGVPTSPAQDSINLVPPFDPQCLPMPNPAAVVGSGGDGGPGVIQLHVRDLASILAPTSANTFLPDVVRPLPVGSAQNPNDPATWDRLVTPYGPTSSARSLWTSIGNPGGPAQILFGGTGPDGRVRTNGATPNARVAPADPIVVAALAAGGGLPRVDVDGRTLLVASSSFAQSVWAADTSTLVDGIVELGAPGASRRFDVESATPTAFGIVRLTVTEPGAPLAGFVPGDPVVVRPRFFRVATNGVRDWLPSSASIRITFQGAPDDGNGAPDMSMASAWSPDVNAAEVPNVAWIRYQVDFDLTADGSALQLGDLPALEFLRIPFER